MAKEPIRVLVTGAAGQIAYSLVATIARGEVFGADQPIILHLLDIPMMLGVLNGVVMELIDCAFPLLKDIVATDSEQTAFAAIDVAFLVGSMPRKEGMERKDLLAANVKIFKSQGRALDQHAKKSVKVLVVGNPANTNALVCSKFAPSIPKENFSAMTRLDHNRAKGQIAQRLKVSPADVRNVVIWGNHSSTQFPDANHATVNLDGKTVKVTEAINDADYFKGDFVTASPNDLSPAMVPGTPPRLVCLPHPKTWSLIFHLITSVIGVSWCRQLRSWWHHSSGDRCGRRLFHLTRLLTPTARIATSDSTTLLFLRRHLLPLQDQF
ncbi:putative malate dehydrogenase [Ixodes scapularis]